MADLLPAPASLDTTGPQTPVLHAAPEFFLCVSRLLPYKHVQATMEAFSALDTQLLVVGEGPEQARLERHRPPNVALLGTVSDAELRWLYANCIGVVAAANEDYGLTPLEALCFGRPAAVLRYGGFLDTVHEGETGVFFERPEPAEIAAAVVELRNTSWDPGVLDSIAAGYREETFVKRLQDLAAELWASG